MPQTGIGVRGDGGDERRPVLANEEAGIPSLNGEHGTQDGAVSGIPAHPRAEDVFPDQHAAAVHPGGVEFVGMIAVPALDTVLKMARFKPFVA